MTTRIQNKPKTFMMQMEYYQNRITSVEFTFYVLIHMGQRIEISKGK